MILDSSAIITVLLREPGFEDVLNSISSADNLAIAGPTLAETGIVLGSRIGDSARSILVQFVHEWRVSIIPFGEEHWQEAVDAYQRFGKGRHKAALNFGDCLTFAAARLARRPLLCTGDDFAKTDLQLAK
jgi:ribonuclease VapC